MDKIKAGCLAALMCWATGAAALSPLPGCVPDPNGPEGRYSSGYSPLVLGNGFVQYTAWDSSEDITVDILEYCPDGRQVVLRVGVPGADAALEEAARTYFSEMIFGPDGFTQSEMARRLQAIGADASVRTVSYESCACRY